MLRFLIFADFLSFLPNKKINVFTKFSNFCPYLAFNSKNQQKLTKIRNNAISKGMFEAQKAFQNSFLEFLFIFSLF